MQYKEFKKLNGEKISSIGLGTWAMGGGKDWPDANDQTSIQTIHRALDHGINFIDTAAIYGRGHSEEVVGQALKDGKRNQIFLASKCGLPWDENDNVVNDLSKENIFKEIDASLKRLNTDVIDLYQMHWPDPKTDLEETMEALVEIRKAGKIRHIGVSNFSLEDTKKCEELGGIVSHQGLYNLFERNATHYHNIPLAYEAENEILPFLEDHGMFFLPYSPLMQGVLAGSIPKDRKFKEGEARSSNPMLQGENLNHYLQKLEKLKEIANDLNITLAQLSLAWIAHQKAMGPVIFGTYKEDHILEAAQTADIQLSSDLLHILSDVSI